MLGARIAQRRQIEPRKEMLAAAQQDRRDRDVHFVDEARLEILAHRGRPAADLDIAPARTARGLPGATERFVNSAGDEMKDGPAFHRDRFARVVRQHEHRHMIYAPMPSPKRLAKSLSGPVVPPVCPCISRNPRVPRYQPCRSSPPTPSGFSRSWRGPAPYPSSEIAKLWTRSLDMESSALNGPYASSSFSNIHEVPNRSRNIANRFAKNVRSIFMKIWPPSQSSA